jgi:hypothetical protein
MLEKSPNIPFKKSILPCSLHTRRFSPQLSIKPYLEFGCQLDIKTSFLKAKRWFMIHVFMKEQTIQALGYHGYIVS